MGRVWIKGVLDRRDSECKGPETAKDVMCPRGLENAIVFGGSGGVGPEASEKLRKEAPVGWI